MRLIPDTHRLRAEEWLKLAFIAGAATTTLERFHRIRDHGMLLPFRPGLESELTIYLTVILAWIAVSFRRIRIVRIISTLLLISMILAAFYVLIAPLDSRPYEPSPFSDSHPHGPGITRRLANYTTFPLTVAALLSSLWSYIRHLNDSSIRTEAIKAHREIVWQADDLT